MERGDLLEEHAMRIGKQILRDNAMELFGSGVGSGNAKENWDHEYTRKLIQSQLFCFQLRKSHDKSGK